MSKPGLNIITSPEAKRMLSMVTKGFYDRSYTGLWMFEVMGREYDEIAKYSRSLRNEIFPQTCTWSMPIWERIYGLTPDDTIPLDYRRKRLLSRKLSRPPVNPARIETVLSALTNCPVSITENVASYTFRVVIDDSSSAIFNHKAVIKTLREIKPSHLSIDYGIYNRFQNCNTARLYSVDFHMRLFNLSDETNILDGRRILDGSWSLGQVFRKGISVHSINFEFNIKNAGSVNCGAGFIMPPARNRNRTFFPVFKMKAQAKNQLAARLAGTGIHARTKHNGKIKGAVTIDAMYRIDGSVLLDGSRKLNADIIKEVI